VSDPLLKHSRMPRKLSRMTLRRREQQAIGGVHSLSEVDPKGVVQRYIAGEKMKTMAEQYGVSDIALYAFVLRHCKDDWLAAQSAKAFAMKERGQDGLENPENPLQLSGDRELVRAGQWDLERVMRKEYGRDEQNININVFDLGERLRRAKERTAQVIEHSESTSLTFQPSRGHEESGQLADQAIEAEDLAETHVQAQQSAHSRESE
jgi:hypothetical protein